MKRDTSKRVTLPNCRTFVARYEHIAHNHLPGNVRLRQPYRQRAAPCGRCCHQIVVQQDHGIGSNTLKSAKKVVQKHQLCESLVKWH